MIIELVDLTVTEMHIDYIKQVVRVEYALVDENGVAWNTGEAFFWVTVPDPGYDDDGNPLPIPQNWFQLPSSYFPTLLQLQTDADSVLTARFFQ